MASKTNPLNPDPQVEVEGSEDEIELTALEELQEFATLLREGDEQMKAGEALKESAKQPFLELISEVVRSEVPLVREVKLVQNTELERFGYDYDKWAAAKYPTWTVVAVEVGEPNVSTNIAIEESDKYKKYEFEFDGYKFGRTTAMKGKSFDTDGFLDAIKELKPLALRKKLQALVTEETVVVKKFNEAKATKLMADDSEAVAYIQDFINEGVPEVRLLPIKPVKETEE